MKADVIVGLQHGDEGKGKVCLCLSKDEKYTLCKNSI
jgi:adenylosuccinate synthase